MAQSGAMSADLLRRIHDFVTRSATATATREAPPAAAAAGELDALAREAFAFQYEHLEPYRRLCAGRGASPGTVGGWREVPMVPAAAFKTLDLSVAAAVDEATVETFRSSGTSRGEAERSLHRHPFPDLYRATVDAVFPAACPLLAGRPPMLALVPDREQAPDSSLSFMVDHLVSHWGGEGSTRAFGRRGVDPRAARSWIGARQRDGRAALLLATGLALADLLAALEKMGLRFRLPPGSVAMVTGGFKGQQREVSQEELAAKLADFLGVPRERILGEYGMTELTSQLYSRNLVVPETDPALFFPPPWVRVRCLDPGTLEEVADGEAGLVAIFDLANLGSAVHLLTEDLGRMEEAPDGTRGLRLAGRAAGAELRGCSLTVEELSG